MKIKRKYFGTKTSIALAFLRIGMGIVFMIHGYDKLFGGVEKWTGLGGYVLSRLGIEYGHAFFGFMAGFAEFGGGLFLVLGIFYYLSLDLLIITMIAAIFVHVSNGDPISRILHPTTILIVFITMYFLPKGRLLGYKMVRIIRHIIITNRTHA